MEMIANANSPLMWWPKAAQRTNNSAGDVFNYFWID